jgi:hypothetical protein
VSMESKARTANVRAFCFCRIKRLFLPWQGHDCGCEASQPGKHLFCWHFSEGLPLPHLSDALLENTGADVLLPPPAPGYSCTHNKTPTDRPVGKVPGACHVVWERDGFHNLKARTSNPPPSPCVKPWPVGCCHPQDGGASSTTLACVSLVGRRRRGEGKEDVAWRGTQPTDVFCRAEGRAEQSRPRPRRHSGWCM